MVNGGTMKMSISYTEALTAYPKETAEAVAELRKSRSKHRKTDPSTLPWEFSWGVEVKAHSFADLLSGKAQQDAVDRDKMSLNERVQDEVKRTKVSIGVAGRYYAKLPDVPQPIVDGIVKGHEARIAEEQRIASLTPEQRQAEVNDALRQLGGGRGFFAVQF